MRCCAAVARRRPAIILLILAQAMALGAQSSAGAEDATLDPPSGRYPAPISIGPPDEPGAEYRFLGTDGQPHTDFFLDAARGIVLGGPDGSEIRYTLELRGADRQSRTVSYVIDRLAPPAPVLEPAPGLYREALTLTGRSGVMYRVAEQEAARFRPVPEAGIELDGLPGTVRDYTVLAYAVDSVGNRSPVSRLTYRLDLRDEAPPRSQPLLAPAAGAYANPQTIFLDSRGLTVEAFTLHDDSDTVTPLEPDTLISVPGTGRYRVTLRARRRDTGMLLEQSAEWRQISATSPGLPASGRYSEGLVLRPPQAGLRYTLRSGFAPRNDERSELWLEVLRIAAVSDTLRPVTLRYRISSGETVRLLYLMDGRRAPPPLAIAEEEGARLLLVGLGDTELEWRSPDGFEAAPRRVERAALSWLSEAESILLRSRFRGGPWTEVRRDLPPAPAAQREPGIPRLEASLGVLSIPERTQRLELMDGEADPAAGREPVVVLGPGPASSWQLPWGYRSRLHVSAGETGDTGITVNNAPPAPPGLQIENDVLRLSGDGELYFRLDDGPDQLYSRPVSLAGVANGLRRYRISAYRLVDGVVSAESETTHVIDRRTPVIGDLPAEILSASSPARVRLSSPYDDVVFHYETAPGTRRPPLPDENSPSTADVIALEGRDGENVQVSVSVRARFEGASRWSPLARTVVSIDQEAPAAPALDADSLQEGVLAFGAHPEEEVRIYYRLVGSGEPEQEYLAPVTLDRTSVVAIEAVAQDPAGNRTPLGAPLPLSAPGRRPVAPDILVNGRSVTAPSLASGREVELGLQDTSENTTLRWRVVQGDSAGGDFRPFTTRETLGPGTYRIEAYSEFPEGQRSDLRRLDLVITSSEIAAPPEPELLFNPDGLSGTLVWPGSAARQIFASVVPVDEDPAFQLVEGALEWSVDPDTSRLRISYFATDVDGRRSSTVVIERELQPAATLLAPTGIENGGLYRSPQRIRFPEDAGIRYTLGTIDEPPPPVSALSRPAEGNIDLTVPAGEETTFLLRYRSYAESRPRSSEREIRATIDRQPPAPPVLSGLVDNGYYSSTRELGLAPAHPEDRIFYRIRRADTSGASPGSFQEIQPERAPLLPAGPELRQYAIEAYAVDRAGNRSQELLRSTVTIDPFTLHVDPRAGADDNDGSRAAPLASLDRALQRLSDGDLTGIFLAAGSYTVDGDLWARVQDELATRGAVLSLRGGFQSGSWQPDAAPSVLGVAGQTTVDLRAGLNLSNLRISQALRFEPDADAGADADANLLRLERVVIERRPAETALTVRAGRLELRDSAIGGVIQLLQGTVGRLENISGDGIVVSGARLEALGGTLGQISMSGGARGSLEQLGISGNSDEVPGRALLDLDRGTLTLAGVTIAAEGRDAIGIRSRDAQLTIRDSSVAASGATTALAVRGSGSEIRILNSSLVARAESAYGASLRGGSLSVDRGAVHATGLNDAVGLVAVQTELNLRSSVVWTTGRNGRSSLSALNIDSGGITGATLDTAVLVADYGGESDPSGAGVAIETSRSGELAVADSRFIGWEIVLQGSSDAASWGTGQRFTTIEDLEALSDANRRNRALGLGTLPDLHVEAWRAMATAGDDFMGETYAELRDQLLNASR